MNNSRASCAPRATVTKNHSAYLKVLESSWCGLYCGL